MCVHIYIFDRKLPVFLFLSQNFRYPKFLILSVKLSTYSVVSSCQISFIAHSLSHYFGSFWIKDGLGEG